MEVLCIFILDYVLKIGGLVYCSVFRFWSM